MTHSILLLRYKTDSNNIALNQHLHPSTFYIKWYEHAQSVQMPHAQMHFTSIIIM